MTHSINNIRKTLLALLSSYVNEAQCFNISKKLLFIENCCPNCLISAKRSGIVAAMRPLQKQEIIFHLFARVFYFLYSGGD